MSADEVDKSRRRFLTTATTVVGGIGAAFTAVPFISSMQPSAKAVAAGAPVEIDIGNLEVGQKITIEWRGKPVWIVRRDAEILGKLETIKADLRDPDSAVADQQPAYAQNGSRAKNPEYLVVIGICTHLGCSPTYLPPGETHGLSLGDSWHGGFFCPCHGSRFDLAGRVYKGVPAPTNLVVPPYTFLSPTRILVGEDQGVA